MPGPKTINEEAGLGPNWVPLDAPPIVPGQMVSAPPASDTAPVTPKYLSGTIAPNFQHDSDFTDTYAKTNKAPKFDLMPLGPQQNAISAVQISSVVRSVVSSVPSAATTDDDTIHLNAQTGTQYTVQLSDLNKLISLSNNAGGTVFLPPVAGTTNTKITNTVDVPFTSGNSTSSGQVVTSVYTFTATNPVAVGDFMFLSVRRANGSVTSTMSDSLNGSWTGIQLSAAGDNIALFWVRNTVAIPVAGTVVLTLKATFGGVLFNPDINEFWTMQGIKGAAALAQNSGSASGTTFSSGGLTVSAPTAFIALGDSTNGDLLNQAPANSQNKAWSQIGGGNPGTLRSYSLLNINGGPVNDVWTPSVSGNGFIDFLQSFTQALIGDISKLTTDFSCYIENTGSGTFTLVSTAPIDGTNANGAVTIGQNQGMLLLWDAASQAWYTERGLGSGGALTIQQDGSALPAEKALNFLNPLTATDNPGNTSTDVTLFEKVNAQTGTTYTFLTTDKGHLVTFSNTASVAVTLPQAGSAGFPAGWFTDVENLNQGVVTITPSTSTINGQTTFVVYMNQGARIVSDGTNYFVILGASTAEASEPVNAQTGTTYTVADTDRSKLVTFSNSSAVAVTLPQAATSSKFASGWFADFENLNTGVVTITPTTSTINGVATYTLLKGQGVRIVSDGTNYQVQQGSPTLQTQVDARTTTTEAINDSDRGKTVTFSNSSAVAATIAQAGASSSFIAGWYAWIMNVNSGIVTLTPTTSTVNGDTTLVLQKNQGGILVSDGSNYFFLGANLGDQNTTLTDGFVMVYDGTNHKWFAQSPGSISGISAVQLRGKNIAAAVGSAGAGQDFAPLTWVNANSDFELIQPAQNPLIVGIGYAIAAGYLLA